MKRNKTTKTSNLFEIKIILYQLFCKDFNNNKINYKISLFSMFATPNNSSNKFFMLFLLYLLLVVSVDCIHVKNQHQQTGTGNNNASQIGDRNLRKIQMSYWSNHTVDGLFDDI